MRCFISINLPNNLKNELNRVSQALQEQGIFTGSFAQSQGFHFNLKFLGEISENRVEDIKKALQKIQFKPFEVSLKSLGAFPSKNYVKVMWIGIDEGEAEMVKLSKKVEDEMAKLGFQREKRAFKPHLTLARVKFVNDKEQLAQVFEMNKSSDFGKFYVDKIHLMNSILMKTGAVYEEV